MIPYFSIGMNMIKKNSWLKAIILTILLFSSNKNLVAMDNIKVGFETQKLEGFSSYTIGGITDTNTNQIIFHFPVSELKFPLNIYVGKIQIEGNLTNRLRFSLNGSKNINRSSGKLEDSDWLTPKSTQKDIYSESDTQLNAWGVDGKLSYLIKKMNYSNHHDTRYTFSLGYNYQNYAFEAHDLEQSYPSDPTKENVIQAGKVITYKVVSKVPFWEFGVEHRFRNTFGSISLGYAPHIKLQDRDDHILRAKLAEGNLTGQIQFLTVGLQHYFTHHWSGFLGYKHQIIQSRGKQKQSRYEDTKEGNAGHIADLDQKVDSELSSLTFGFAYQFDQLRHQNKETKPYVTRKTPFIQPSIGISYLYPISEQEPSPGPNLELETKHLIFGISYHKGNNKIKTFSKGLHTTLPVYTMIKVPASKNISLQIGGGYSFNTNEIDPHVVSHLTTLGFPNSKETLSSAWIGIVGLEYAPFKDKDGVKYRLQYRYQKPKLYSKSDKHDTATNVEIQQLSLGMQVFF